MFSRQPVLGPCAPTQDSRPLDQDILRTSGKIISWSTINIFVQNLIITLQLSPSICFWRHSWFVPDSSKLDSAHLSFQQGFVVQFPRPRIGTPDIPKLWNRKFSAPLSRSSKLENCVNLSKIVSNQGFVRRKVCHLKCVRPAPMPFPLFLGI